ncbi:hypothetical protein [Paenibacillus rhizoplanae]|uniref:hypothetical protein n=1 Tax=Paenibacillus rhizoplanae TaxID=1917181 RepID=UPI00360A1CDA
MITTKKDPQLPELHLGIRTHEQGIGLPVNMDRHPNGIAELIIEKAGHEQLAGEIPHPMVDLPVQHLAQRLLLEVIFAERQAVEAFLSIGIDQIHLVPQGSRTQEIFFHRIRVILNKLLQTYSHPGQLSIIFRLDL